MAKKTENTLHFGKHKGKPLPSVPAEYLEWVILSVEDRRPVEACIAELDRRGAKLARKRAKVKRQWDNLCR